MPLQVAIIHQEDPAFPVAPPIETPPTPSYHPPLPAPTPTHRRPLLTSAALTPRMHYLHVPCFVWTESNVLPYMHTSYKLRHPLPGCQPPQNKLTPLSFLSLTHNRGTCPAPPPSTSSSLTQALPGCQLSTHAAQKTATTTTSPEGDQNFEGRLEPHLPVPCPLNTQPPHPLPQNPSTHLLKVETGSSGVPAVSTCCTEGVEALGALCTAILVSN